MSGSTQLSETLDEQPVFTGFWTGLRSLFRLPKCAARDQAPAGWPDELSAHYLRDASLEHGPNSILSEPTMHLLRVGPRPS